jgi:DNA-binding MarR family transcriptional regulator
VYGRDTIYLVTGAKITSADYQSLAELRHQIRRFLRFSERAARIAGLEPRQHQLLLALKGLPQGARLRIAEIASRMQIQHHSAVELVNRLAERKFVRRQQGGTDRREVFIRLTPKAQKVLQKLSVQHKKELTVAGPTLIGALEQVMHGCRRVASPAWTSGGVRGNEKGKAA